MNGDKTIGKIPTDLTTEQGYAAAKLTAINHLSVLKDEIGGARLTGDSESVVIPTDSEDFPINEGLTSAKLSNWGVASHTYFDKSLLDASKWKAINDYSVLDGPNAVTIVTASEASGSTDPNDIPEPQTLVLFALSLLLLSYRKIVK